MFTKITTVEEFQAMFTEMLLNKTNRVTKVSDASVLKGVAFGNAKNAQKINKDVAILESYLYPDVATDEKLDAYGRLNGIGQRFGTRQSSTYLLLVAAPNTRYFADTHLFRSISGTTFQLEKDVVIGDIGWTYAKVRSTTKGESTNVEALTINQVTPAPSGHQFCINEYRADFGGDYEEDDVYRKRVKTSADALARSSIGMLEQVFMKINENVLRVYYSGLDDNGRVILSILTVNGIDLTEAELNDIYIRGEKYFSLTEMKPTLSGFSIKLQNVQWQPIDISMRLEIEASYNPDMVRKLMQITMNKYLDYRYFVTGGRVEWDNLLQIAKTTEGVRYVVDAFFYPNADFEVDVYKLPRIRGFRLLDKEGGLISDKQGVLNPVYFPNDIDFIYQTAALQNI